MPRVDGARALQQAEPVVSASTSNEHTPANTSDSIISAETSITSDIENETTQVENAQNRHMVPLLVTLLDSKEM